MFDNFAEIQEKEKFIVDTFKLFPEDSFSPVQIQKLFFLIQKRLVYSYFDFQPYHYGPYSFSLNDFLKICSDSYQDPIVKKNINGISHYSVNVLTVDFSKSFFDQKSSEFIKQLGKFVKDLSFKDLCMAIYAEFPEMAKNSVFFKT